MDKLLKLLSNPKTSLEKVTKLSIKKFAYLKYPRSPKLTVRLALKSHFLMFDLSVFEIARPTVKSTIVLNAMRAKNR